MTVFELVIALLFVGGALSVAARRVRVPYPALLALAGAGLALLRDIPTVVLDPDLALTLFLAPILVDAAFDSSPRDLRKNWRHITALALLAVGLTVAAVAVVARHWKPELPWAAAIALGAIVAPPDAAAATTVLKQLRLPHQLLVVLEGESLFNDASALLIYRVAVATTLTGTFSGWSVLPLLAASSLGSALLGLVLARLILAAEARIADAPTAVLLQFLATFAVWILAEQLHLSGVIAVVAFGLVAGRLAPPRTPARTRVLTNAVWEVAVFVLNVLAFILMGLQLKPIMQRLPDRQLAHYAAAAAAICAAVILVRMAWVMLREAAARAIRHFGPRQPAPRRHLSLRAAFLVAWCGLRGIVTLAAALALPVGSDGQPAFPHRDFILFTAFGVVLVTLVLQGMTLTPLIHLLALDDDRAVEREVVLARKAAAQAGLAALEGAEHSDGEAGLVRRRYELRLRRFESPEPPDERAAMVPAEVRAPHPARRALEAERRILSDLRARGVIGDDAYHLVEEELDWAELNADAKSL